MRIILSVLFLFATLETKGGATPFTDAIYCRPYSRLMDGLNFMGQSSLRSTIVSRDVLLSHIPLSYEELDRNVQKIERLSKWDLIADPNISFHYIKPLLKILGQTQLYPLISYDGINLIETIMVPALQIFREANYSNQFFMVKQILSRAQMSDSSTEYFLYHPYKNNIFDDCIDATETYLMTISMEMEILNPKELYYSDTLMEAFEGFKYYTNKLIRGLRIQLLQF